MVDLTLQEGRPDGLSQDLGSPYWVVPTGGGGSRSHELKCSFRLTHRRECAAGNPLHIDTEARIVPIREGLLAPSNGAGGIARQMRLMSGVEEAFCVHRRIRGQLGRPVQSPGGRSQAVPLARLTRRSHQRCCDCFIGADCRRCQVPRAAVTVGDLGKRSVSRHPSRQWGSSKHHGPQQRMPQADRVSRGRDQAEPFRGTKRCQRQAKRFQCLHRMPPASVLVGDDNKERTCARLRGADRTAAPKSAPESGADPCPPSQPTSRHPNRPLRPYVDAPRRQAGFLLLSPLVTPVSVVRRSRSSPSPAARTPPYLAPLATTSGGRCQAWPRRVRLARPAPLLTARQLGDAPRTAGSVRTQHRATGNHPPRSPTDSGRRRQ